MSRGNITERGGASIVKGQQTFIRVLRGLSHKLGVRGECDYF